MGFHGEILLINPVLRGRMEMKLCQGVGMISYNEGAIRQRHFDGGAEVLEFEVRDRRDIESDGAIVDL